MFYQRHWLAHTMPEPPLTLSSSDLADIENHVEGTISNGKHIRDILANNSRGGPWNTEWEVEAAVEALPLNFVYRWSKKIQSTQNLTLRHIQ